MVIIIIGIPHSFVRREVGSIEKENWRKYNASAIRRIAK